MSSYPRATVGHLEKGANPSELKDTRHLRHTTSAETVRCGSFTQETTYIRDGCPQTTSLPQQLELLTRRTKHLTVMDTSKLKIMYLDLVFFDRPFVLLALLTSSPELLCEHFFLTGLCRKGKLADLKAVAAPTPAAAAAAASPTAESGSAVIGVETQNQTPSRQFRFCTGKHDARSHQYVVHCTRCRTSRRVKRVVTTSP